MSGVDFGPLTDLPLGREAGAGVLADERGRCLVMDADGHRAAWKPAAPPSSPVTGVRVVVLPAEGPEWYCDACERELDRTCPIPLEDGFALCRPCAERWGFPRGWRRLGAVKLCPCDPCAAAAASLSRTDRRAC